MNYEINISLNGKHFVATDKRSLTTVERAKEVFCELRRRFPADQGYEVKCCRWESSGTAMNWENVVDGLL